MPDLATALRRIHGHSGSLLAEATAMLRELVADACRSLAAAEGSILVPVEGTNELRFFISLNPVLESEEVSVPIDGSISGYVFTTRQAMAKIKPESAGVAKVDEVAKSQTSFLLAVPIVDDERVYGVATFVNRTSGKEETPFSIEDLRVAQQYGEIYGTAMKLHRRIEFCTSSARIEIASHAGEFVVEGVPQPTETELAAQRYRLPALLAEKAADLPGRERELLFRIGELIGEYAGIDGERAAHDL
jgi:transcriptional regulator with GAF, ATPase, and Fis domain